MLRAASSGAQLVTDASGNVTGLLGPDGGILGGLVLRPRMVGGGANDTAAINAAIAAVSTMAGGGVVELPVGSFYAAGIVMKSNVWLRGQGMGVTTLKLPNNSWTTTGVPLDTTNIIFCKAVGADLYGFRISGMTLDGNRANQTEPNGYDNGLNCICVRGSNDASAYYARNFLIEDVELKSAIWHGIALYDGVRDYTINRMHAWDNGYRGGHCHSSDSNLGGASSTAVADSRYRIMNCTIHDNGQSTGANMQTAGYMNSGLFAMLNNNYEAIVSGNTIYNEVGPGIDIAGVDNGGQTIASRYHVVSGNTIYACGEGIKVGGSADSVIISSNTIRACTKSGRPAGTVASGAGISFDTAGTLGASNIKLRGNIVSDCYGWGIAFNNATNKWKAIEISGNHVLNNCQGSTSGTSYGGIFMQACDGCIVTGNIVKGNANAGAADRQFYTTTVTNTVITNNIFDSSLKFDGTAYAVTVAADIASNGSGLVFCGNYCYRNGSGNGYNFAAANSTHFNNTGDKANSASFVATGGGPRFNHDITSGAGSAALGANCPAVTASAPYAWTKVTTMDGSTGYVPVWK
jgi:hypothetical protein